MAGAKWIVDGARLRALRTSKMWTISELAARSGVAERTIGDLENGARATRPETIRCLAKALAVEPEQLLAPAPAPAPAPALPPAKLPSRTRLDALADLQRERGIAPPPLAIAGKTFDVLTPARMQDVFARHAAFEGARFAVVGKVDQQRALSSQEARALESKVGVGARYHVAVEILPGEPLGVTVHAVDATIADALQAAMGKPVRVVVRVRVCGDDDARVVSLFASSRKRAWAFVAERVIAPSLVPGEGS